MIKYLKIIAYVLSWYYFVLTIVRWKNSSFEKVCIENLNLSYK